jgi:hypothetical protein
MPVSVAASAAGPLCEEVALGVLPVTTTEGSVLDLTTHTAGLTGCWRVVRSTGQVLLSELVVHEYMIPNLCALVKTDVELP